MDYDNPPLPEGINDSPDRPWRDFLIYGAGIIGAVFIAFVGLFVIGSFLGHMVPFSVERRMVALFAPEDLKAPTDPAGQCLQSLANRVVATLPPDQRLPIIVRYRNSSIINAFAAPGGQITFFRGLIEKLPTEDAIAAVIAHEIAHIQHRDVISQNLAQILSAISTALVQGNNTSFTRETIVRLNRLIALYYSRSAETKADLFALNAVQTLYGHGGGAIKLFNVMATLPDAPSGGEIWHSHPDTLNRIAAIEDLARAKNWPLDGPSPNFDFIKCGIKKESPSKDAPSAK